MKAKFILLTLAMAAASLGVDPGLGRHRGHCRQTATWAASRAAGRPARALRREVRVVLDIQGRRVDAAISTPQGIRLQVQGEVKLDETTSPRSLDWIKFTGADQQEFPPDPGDLQARPRHVHGLQRRAERVSTQGVQIGRRCSRRGRRFRARAVGLRHQKASRTAARASKLARHAVNARRLIVQQSLSFRSRLLSMSILTSSVELRNIVVTRSRMPSNPRRS